MKQTIQLYQSFKFPDSLNEFIRAKMIDGWRVVSIAGDSGSASNYREAWYACVMEKEIENSPKNDPKG